MGSRNYSSLIVLLLSCASYIAFLPLCGGATSLAGAGGDDAPLTFRSLAQGTASGIIAPQELVVASAPAWQALWTQHAPSEPSPPPIDFAIELIVGIFLGQQPTAGYQVQVIRVERRDTEVRIIYQVNRPPPDALVAQVQTQPFQLISVPRVELPLRFERR
jgi:PrcB C-terminal